MAAGGSDDYEIRQDHDDFVAPTVDAVLAPKTGVPGGDFFWAAPSITRIRPMAASCVSTPKAMPRAPAHSATPRKSVKPLLMPMSLLRASELVRCFQPLVKKIRATMRRRSRRAMSV